MSHENKPRFHDHKRCARAMCMDQGADTSALKSDLHILGAHLSLFSTDVSVAWSMHMACTHFLCARNPEDMEIIYFVGWDTRPWRGPTSHNTNLALGDLTPSLSLGRVMLQTHSQPGTL